MINKLCHFYRSQIDYLYSQMQGLHLNLNLLAKYYSLHCWNTYCQLDFMLFLVRWVPLNLEALLVLINCDLCAFPSIKTQLDRVRGLENSNIPALFRPLSYFLSSFTVSKIGQYQLRPSKILTSSGSHFELYFANSVKNGELRLRFP